MIKFILFWKNNLDTENGSESCVCPARFTGLRCDKCTQNGPKIRPYPDCTIDMLKSKARLQRQKSELQVSWWVFIIISKKFMVQYRWKKRIYKV